VNIFDKFSNLKRMAVAYGYAPKILENVKKLLAYAFLGC